MKALLAVPVFVLTVLFVTPLYADVTADAGGVLDEGILDEGSELVLEGDSIESGGILDEGFLDEGSELTIEGEAFGDSEEGLEDGSEKFGVIQDVLEATRFTLKHELSYKTTAKEGVKSNRSSFRFEFEKFFFNYFYLQFDGKLMAFWGNDHRAIAEDEDVFFETSSKERFLQFSFADTSIKVGVQVLIWGESDGGAITDVISPRDYSELFFISLEESRIGQRMVLLDQYSGIGDWTLFYIPEASFNEYPKEGTEYYHDSFAGQAVFRDDTSDVPDDEYGVRWKKTFGKSDVSFMMASLIDNKKALRLDGTDGSGKKVLTRTLQRYRMAGLTFNYVKGSFLFKGEMARKSKKAFNNSSLLLLEKDVADIALALEYSRGGSYTATLEAINSRILDWDEEIQGVPEDSSSLVFSWSNSFLNDDLTISWMSSYSTPYTSWLHQLGVTYDWDDNLSLFLDGYYPDVRDDRNGFWVYRDQKQVAFKIEYLF